MYFKKGENMDTIKFTFTETNEDVIFAILGSVEYEDNVYLMVVEEEELESEDMTAYIMKAIEEDGEEIVYEIVDDEDELDALTERFEEVLENFDIENDYDYDEEEDEDDNDDVDQEDVE